MMRGSLGQVFHSSGYKAMPATGPDIECNPTWHTAAGAPLPNVTSMIVDASPGIQAVDLSDKHQPA